MTFDPKRFSLALALIAGSSLAQAANPLLAYCNNCSSTQVNALVLSVSAPEGSIIYVGDLSNGSVGAYSVWSDIDDSQHPPKRVKYVNTLATDANIKLGITNAISFYKLTPVGWHKHYDLVYNGPDSGNMTAWRVANAGPDQTTFNTWLNTAGTGDKTSAQLWGLVTQETAMLTKVDPAAIPNEQGQVDFADGSKEGAVQDMTTGKLKGDPNSAIDAEGNPIPYIDAAGAVHNLGGKHIYPDTYDGNRDQNAFNHQISGMPVIIQTPGGGSSGSGGGNPWVCVESGEGESTVYTCTRG